MLWKSKQYKVNVYILFLIPQAINITKYKEATDRFKDATKEIKENTK